MYIIIHAIYIDDIVQQIAAVCVDHNKCTDLLDCTVRTMRHRRGKELSCILATIAAASGRNGQLILLDAANVRKFSRLWHRIRHNRPPCMLPMSALGVAVPDAIADCGDAKAVVRKMYWALLAAHAI